MEQPCSEFSQQTIKDHCPQLPMKYLGIPLVHRKLGSSWERTVYGSLASTLPICTGFLSFWRKQGKSSYPHSPFGPNVFDKGAESPLTAINNYPKASKDYRVISKAKIWHPDTSQNITTVHLSTAKLLKSPT